MTSLLRIDSYYVYKDEAQRSLNMTCIAFIPYVRSVQSKTLHGRDYCAEQMEDS